MSSMMFQQETRQSGSCGHYEKKHAFPMHFARPQGADGTTAYRKHPMLKDSATMFPSSDILELPSWPTANPRTVSAGGVCTRNSYEGPMNQRVGSAVLVRSSFPETSVASLRSNPLEDGLSGGQSRSRWFGHLAPYVPQASASDLSDDFVASTCVLSNQLAGLTTIDLYGPKEMCEKFGAAMIGGIWSRCEQAQNPEKHIRELAVSMQGDILHADHERELRLTDDGYTSRMCTAYSESEFQRVPSLVHPDSSSHASASSPQDSRRSSSSLSWDSNHHAFETYSGAIESCTRESSANRIQNLRLPMKGSGYSGGLRTSTIAHNASNYGLKSFEGAFKPQCRPPKVSADCSATSDDRRKSTTIPWIRSQGGLQRPLGANKGSQPQSLSAILGDAVELCGDQHGSRFIQIRLASASTEERHLAFCELQPHFLKLMTDPFGNYVVQKLFEHGDQVQRQTLTAAMRGKLVALSRHPYGCRVIQAALRYIAPEQQITLIDELRGSVTELIKDQNGNHVIQKAIEHCAASSIDFVVTSMRGQIYDLSNHSYGCRVVQRCLEKSGLHSKAWILAELASCIHFMIRDQYGNYVVQHIVSHDQGECQKRVLVHVRDHAETLSRHKYASNVVEKCIQHSNDQYRRVIVHALSRGDRQRSGDEVLLGMIQDQYGNYVVQKLLDTIRGSERHALILLLQPAIARVRRANPQSKQVLAIQRRIDRYLHALDPGTPHSQLTS